MKQSANFAFSRVYHSGHEVPFYQPLLSLEMFERVLAGVDLATGKTVVRGAGASGSYATVGTAKSTFREGNSTMQWEVLDPNATYNTTTNAPNPGATNGTAVLEARSGGDELTPRKNARRARKRPARRDSFGMGQNRWWN